MRSSPRFRSLTLLRRLRFYLTKTGGASISTALLCAAWAWDRLLQSPDSTSHDLVLRITGLHLRQTTRRVWFARELSTGSMPILRFGPRCLSRRIGTLLNGTYRNTCASFGKDPYFLRNLAERQIKAKQFDEAQATLDRFLEVSPSSWGYQQLAKVHRLKGDGEQSHEYYGKVPGGRLGPWAIVDPGPRRPVQTIRWSGKTSKRHLITPRPPPNRVQPGPCKTQPTSTNNCTHGNGLKCGSVPLPNDTTGRGMNGIGGAVGQVAETWPRPVLWLEYFAALEENMTPTQRSTRGVFPHTRRRPAGSTTKTCDSDSPQIKTPSLDCTRYCWHTSSARRMPVTSCSSSCLSDLAAGHSWASGSAATQLADALRSNWSEAEETSFDYAAFDERLQRLTPVQQVQTCYFAAEVAEQLGIKKRAISYLRRTYAAGRCYQLESDLALARLRDLDQEVIAKDLPELKQTPWKNSASELYKLAGSLMDQGRVETRKSLTRIHRADRKSQRATPVRAAVPTVGEFEKAVPFAERAAAWGDPTGIQRILSVQDALGNFDESDAGPQRWQNFVLKMPRRGTYGACVRMMETATRHVLWQRSIS